MKMLHWNPSVPTPVKATGWLKVRGVAFFAVD